MSSELFNILHHDHETLLHIVERLENTASDKQWLFKQLDTGLVAHAEGEERAFYPRIQEFPESAEIIQELLAQHQQMLVTLEIMKDHSPTNQDWLASLSEFKNHLQRHIQLEENLFFPMAQNLLSYQELEDITTNFITEKQQIMNELAKPNIRPNI